MHFEFHSESLINYSNNEHIYILILLGTLEILRAHSDIHGHACVRAHTHTHTQIKFKGKENTFVSEEVAALVKRVLFITNINESNQLRYVPQRTWFIYHKEPGSFYLLLNRTK